MKTITFVFADWERRKKATPFGALPVLEVDGKTVSQSHAINRYVRKLVDLHPFGDKADISDQLVNVCL